MKRSAVRELSAFALAAQLQQRTLSAELVVEAFQERIAEREPAVHAWTALAGEAALERARALDRGPILGPLHGLPIGAKDLFDTVDLPTAYGSPIYAGHQPAADAAPVALARAAGAVILGKTVTTEFATYQPGPTRNPHHLDHTPGGSSSGSAAAVADRMVPLAFGSQTAASIIRPASFCGVVGYKPSFGRLTRAGVKSLGESLDTIGGFGSTVDDVSLLLGALMGDASLITLPQLHSAPRIGLFHTAWEQTQPETRAAMVLAHKALSRTGARVMQVKVPERCAAMAQTHVDVMAYEAARALSFELDTQRAQLSPGLATMLDAGRAMSHEQYRALKEAAELARQDLMTLYEDYDILLAPSAAGVAPLASSGTGDPLFCRIWSLFGLPCVHLPFASGPLALPVGLQVVGQFNDDTRCLSMAKWVHERLLAA
jgi:Asp-tRNA(Asn)/Glu-tRNA(Gln) amidotransferase A subunit family amidase